MIDADSFSKAARRLSGERLAANTATLRALPAVPLETCGKRAARVSSTALVWCRTNDYSDLVTAF